MTMTGQLDYPNEPIAIIGSGCRFPGGASSPSKLWNLLLEPRDVLKEIPESRFNAEKFYHQDNLHHGTSNVRHSYTLSENHYEFDTQFFGIKPIEACAMDPQQRILLETTYEALESAGVTMEELRGSNTGVFVGVMTEDYSSLAGRDIGNIPTYLASGTARSILSNRVSHFYDLHGPSMTIDTACSSSLVALHQAVQSLRTGESRICVVAGCNLLLAPDQFVAESKLQMLSPSGRCRMWDKDADGYARGDGFGVLVLKTLSNAFDDKDSIECIVRETGVNQDGRTPGITMPSFKAQADLIKHTFLKTGLDLTKPSDRPQYFEAHGTGTPVGDPIEAQAISTVFFGHDVDIQPGQADHPLYVGSVKTVLGHSEGAAGVAGVLKVSLALKSGIIPPNLLLNNLNPKVEPFYSGLRIPQSPQEWPRTSSGSPRRATVNSFGFGGTNCHAILENFIETPKPKIPQPQKPLPVLPFNFSAASTKSLQGILTAYSTYVKVNQSTSLRDIAWSLNTRRTTLPTRISLSASTSQELIAEIDRAFNSLSEFTTVHKPYADKSKTPRLLGIFTGQGAQWPRMGAFLIRHFPIALECFNRLQKALEALPSDHAPTWSMVDELHKPPELSRIGDAAISQPLCTAIQISLLELLRASNVKLAAVVGHSSGEIAASYAAGFISAQDAIRIAYYRGFFLSLSNKSQGAMLAVKTSSKDARELCELPSLKGRVCIAANNSPNSITLSGDADTIKTVEEILEDEDKTFRRLRVDMAYHSHHMISCKIHYLKALQSLDIQIQTPKASHPVWVSSVTGEIAEKKDFASLSNIYWVENLINTVEFTQALECAVGAYGPFDMAVEIGPHASLKTPALETIQNLTGENIPYTGTLGRGNNDMKAFVTMLGSLWMSLGSGVVDFAAFDKAIYGSSAPSAALVKDLPSYIWDHSRSFSFETRYLKSLRTIGRKPHPLLGTMCADSTAKEVRFKNYISLREIPWLGDHRIQTQIVFPAAGYISAVVEAISILHEVDSVHVVEFSDVIISHALLIPEDGKVETLLSLRITKNSAIDSEIMFTFCSDGNKGYDTLSENASGTVRIIYGSPCNDCLPRPHIPTMEFTELGSDKFYSTTRELGFEYEGLFRGLSRIARKANEATGLVAIPEPRLQDDGPLIIHPSILDCAIQSLIIAYCYPRDGRLRTIHLPRRVDNLHINLRACLDAAHTPDTKLPVYASIDLDQPVDFVGDIQIQSPNCDSTILQVLGLHVTPMTPHSPESDVTLFTEMMWGPELPLGGSLVESFIERPETRDELYDVSFSLERVAYYYLRKLGATFPPCLRDKLQWHHRHFLDYVDHCLAWAQTGTHPYVKSVWANDSEDEILRVFQLYPSIIDLKLMKAAGDGIPAAIRGDVNMLEVLTQDNMLDDFFSHSLAMPSYLKEMSRMVAELSHRFPHMNIIEIGAGVGAATASILQGLKGAFSSYTYTDISTAFFEKARTKFTQDSPKMLFKALDIETSVSQQGFSEGAYDLVIASLSLHATRTLEDTLRNARSLLRPGGYLVMLEVTDNDPLRFGLIFGGLPGWWLGYDEGRKLSPCVSAETWEQLMKHRGFSEIEAITRHSKKFPFPVSVMAFQAVEERISFLRAPLAPETTSQGLGPLTIIGDEAPQEFCAHLTKHYDNITYFRSLGDVRSVNLPFLGSVVSLVDAGEKSVFQDQRSEALQGIQNVFKQSRTVLWVTSGAQYENPFKNIFVGLQRTVALEMTHVHVQVLEFNNHKEVRYDTIAERTLQLGYYEKLARDDRVDDLLWYREPQVLLKNGQVFIPRQRPSHSRNQRYNSIRRVVTQDVVTSEKIISLNPQNAQVFIEGIKPSANNCVREVKLTQSLLKPIHVTETSTTFLSIGTAIESGEEVLLLSNSLHSRVLTPTSWVLSLLETTEHTTTSLISLYLQLLARSIVSKACQWGKLLILTDDRSLGEVLDTAAAKLDVPLSLLTLTDQNCTLPWIYVHPRSKRSSIRRALPPDISVFVDVTNSGGLLDPIRSCLPNDCLQLDGPTFLGGFSGPDMTVSGIQEVSHQLHAAWRDAAGRAVTAINYPIIQMELNRIDDDSLHSQRQALIQWDHERPIRALIQPASKEVRFARDKTYWLVGLTGGLGLTLCEWMAERGAKHIVLSSRRPNVRPVWLQSMASRGCVVKLLSTDVTQRSSIRKAFNNITQTMPQIVGIAQGAMILDDALLQDLDIRRMNRVLGPKVDGSIYLEELLSEDSLDFFVYFSSIAYVAGNAGQSAYAAANGFMASAAANRRSRGLAGSVINIGPIIGNGYIARELTEAKQMALHNAGFRFMSEQDFHEIFAEGVLASNPGSVESLELTTGLRVDDSDGWRNWGLNPTFQHLISRTRGINPTKAGGKQGVPIKTQLLDVSSPEDEFEILKGGLVDKLRLSLQIDPEQAILDLSPDTLGIDSLVAVDLQSWFRRDLGIDLPVLKILNASSILDLLRSAEKLLKPAVVAEASPAADTPQILDTRHNFESTTEELGMDARTSKPRSPDSISSSSGSSTILNVTQDSDPIQEKSIATESLVEIMPIIRKDMPALGMEPRYQRTIPMSFGQSRFWFLRSFLEDQAAFNVTTTAYLRGHLDIHTLREALVTVGQRHEALRTAFYTDNVTKQHMQGVLSSPVIKLEYEPSGDAQKIESVIREIQGHSFDLSNAESLRMKMISLSRDSHILVFGYHHIVMDGIGFQIFFSDLEKAYNGTLDSTGASMLQYPDFTVSQIEEYQQGAWSKELDYWRKQFAVLPTPLPLLLLSRRRFRPESTTFNSHVVKFRLDRSLKDQIEKCCNNFRVTTFHFYLAVLGVLIFRYSDNNAHNLCIGVADANRTNAKVLRSLGLFLNILPIRLNHDIKQIFAELLREVKATSDDAFSNSRVPFSTLLDELAVPRSPSHAPLFQTFLNYRKNIQESLTFCGCETEGELISGGQNAYDITVDIADSVGREDLVAISVNSELYTQQDAEVLKNSYVDLLQGFSHNPAARITRPVMYNELDTDCGIESGRGSEISSRWPGTLIDRIDAMTAAYAEKPALKDASNQSLSYKQMSLRIDGIASKLLEQCLQNDWRVGVFQRPGNDFVCSLLAVLRTRAACVPLDCQLGTERLCTIARHCYLDVVLVDSRTEAEAQSLGNTTTRIINVADIPTQSPKISCVARPSDIAIIAFTSGTTGVPKAILLNHASYKNFVEFSPPRWGFEQGKEVVLQQSSYTFDMALAQIFVCLAYGGTLVIPDTSQRSDPLTICDMIISERITFTMATPTEYLVWTRREDRNMLSNSQWRGAVSGGEPVSERLVEAFRMLRKANLKLVNCYGPSEATFSCADTIIPYSSGEDLAIILSPLPNQSISIVDSEMNPVPIGCAGQVAIGGAGVARGYLDQRDVTSKSFLINEHASSFFHEQGWNTLYLSGDWGRLDTRGGLLLEGRMQGSTQVKVAGVRIDLESVENAIVKFGRPYIHQAVVSLRNNQAGSNKQYLAAFVIISDHEPPEGRKIFLDQLPHQLPLPRYMRPSVVKEVETGTYCYKVLRDTSLM